MSRAIAVHVVAMSVFVAAGTASAQESDPRPAVVELKDTRTSTGGLPTKNDPLSAERDMLAPRVPPPLSHVAGIKGVVGVTVPIAPSIHVNDRNGDVDRRQNGARSAQDASGSSQDKTGTGRRWLAGAMTKMLGFLVAGLASTSGG